MHTGLMWFDSDPQATLVMKIENAAAYFQKKYGKLPDLCLVDPSILDNDQFEVHSKNGKVVSIRPYRHMLPGHLWIGVEEQS